MTSISHAGNDSRTIAETIPPAPLGGKSTRCHLTARIRPFAYVVPSVTRTNAVTLVCLSVMIFFLCMEKQIDSIVLVASSVIGCVAAILVQTATNGRLFLHFARQKRSVILTGVVEGIVTAFILPSGFSPIHAGALTFIFTFASRSLAQKTAAFCARSSLNVPAIVAAVAWIMSSNDGGAMLTSVSAWDGAVTDALNNSVFSLLGVTVPPGYMSLFWNAGEGASISSRFNIITILSSLVLFSCNMADGIITFIFLSVYLLLVRFAGPFFTGGDVLHAALTGGTLFCAVYVIARPGTLPMSRPWKTVYAILCGVFAFFIAARGLYLQSIPFAILCANVLSILMRYAEDAFTSFAAKRKRQTAVEYPVAVQSSSAKA